MLSGGAVLGFFHTGVLKALFDQGLLPEIISGSSAGSILAATACTHPDVELRERLSLDNLHHEVEETTAIRPSLTLFGGSRAMDVDNLRDYLAKIIPDMTFQEAFELTGRKLNITVTGLSTQQAPRLLNAITSPNVLIRSAVMASCAIYGIYPPVTLMCRNAAGETVPYLPGMKWIDGSFADDLPAKRLARLYGVNHFISSMTNPAALAITPDPDAPRSRLRNLAHFQARFLKLGAAEAMRFTRDNVRIKSPVINLMQHLTYGVLAQEYTADINIFLRNRWDHPLRLLAPPTREAMHRLIHEGERSAWEKVEMVRNCTAVSRTLDSILHTRGWEK
jgi:predicted acylesterase/phospholipase RssA